MQDEPNARQVGVGMDDEETLEHALPDSVVNTLKRFGFTAKDFMRSVGAFNDSLQAAVYASSVMIKYYTHAARVIGTALPPTYVRYLPAEVRTIIHLGQQDQFAVRFDGTRTKVRNGRVYMPVHIVTTGEQAEVVFVGERRWTQSQIEDWKRLGFTAILERGDAQRSWRLR